MQRPDEKKRRKITDTAAKLFASRPFHKVRLDDVAAAAHVGKGTLYTYFRSKEDLYASLLHDGSARLLEQLSTQLSPETPPDKALTEIIRQTVAFAFQHPHFFELMRAAPRLHEHHGLSRTRTAFVEMIAAVIRRGASQGIWSDPHPELTALFIPGLVRSAMLYGPQEMDERTLADHMLRLLRQGLCWRKE